MSWIISLVTGLSGRVWLIIGAIAITALWSGYCYKAGYSAADTMWQAKALEAKIAKLELEAKIQRDSDAAEDKLRGELEAENEQQKKVIDEYLKELQSRPDKCLLGDDAGKLQ